MLASTCIDIAIQYKRRPKKRQKKEKRKKKGIKEDYFLFKLLFMCKFIYIYFSGKPRSYSATDIGKITFRNKTEELMFDIISYPAPHKYEIWFVGPVLNSSISSSEKYSDSVMTVTCNTQTDRKYMARCKLTVFNILSEYGLYKLLVINEHGNETFTVEIIHSTTDTTRTLAWMLFSLLVCKLAKTRE